MSAEEEHGTQDAAIEQPRSELTWHEGVYGPHIPSAEHFRTAEAAFQNLVTTNSVSEAGIITGALDDDAAQEYANRVARLELGMREFCRSAGVDPIRATTDVLIGRTEKYIKVWEQARERVLASGHEPTVQQIKEACREMWGKWQFTLEGDEYKALEAGRSLYDEAVQLGMSHEEAQVHAKAQLAEMGFSVERQYVTKDGGDVRVFDISDYLSLKPGLQGIVDSSREFEELTGQSPEDSLGQLASEIGEVVELRSFFQLQSGEKPTDAAQMNLKFASIEEFHSHVEREAEAGTISEGEFNRYIGIQSLEELQRYIQEHLAYECIDVIVAAGGVLHRIPADVGYAVEDARQDRERYAAAVPIIQEAVPEGTQVVPTLTRRVLNIAEQEYGGVSLETAIPLALALLAMNVQSNV